MKADILELTATVEYKTRGQTWYTCKNKNKNWKKLCNLV